jgi:HlyD family secretion protein
MFPQALQLQQATINYETAQANFRVTSRGATEAQLAASQTQVVQAQAALDRLRRGPSKEQLDIAQAAVDQAQIAVEQAQRRLDNTKLTAPWAGVVTAVNVTEGGLAQPGAPAIGLADLSRFHVNVKIDEVDIASIAEGQPASVELDALPGNRLAGRVSKIAPAPAADPTGLIAYQVTIFIDPTDAALRTGMSATVTITSNSRQNVLLMPNRAVQVERETGKTYVERSVDGASQRVEVRLGLRDEQQSEVREGLADGDRVIIRIVSTRARLEQTFGGFSGGR